MNRIRKGRRPKPEFEKGLPFNIKPIEVINISRQHGIKRKRQRYLIFADCETATKANNPNIKDPDDIRLHYPLYSIVPYIFCWRAKKIDKNTNQILDEYEDYISLLNDNNINHEKFFIFLKDIWSKGFEPEIWFHNTIYDIRALVPYFKKLDPDFICVCTLRDPSEKFISGQLYSPKYNFKADLKDTYKYNVISLASCGEIVGLKKLEFTYKKLNVGVSTKSPIINTLNDVDQDDYVEFINNDTHELNQVNLRDELIYCLRDVEITQKYHDVILDIGKNELTNLVIANLPAPAKSYKLHQIETVGSHAKKLLSCLIKSSVNCIEDFNSYFRIDLNGNVSEYRQQRHSCTGGYTSVNKYLKKFYCEGDYEDWRISYYDCNSMYPYVLKEGVPCGYLLDNPPNNSEYIIWRKVTFFKCDWKDKYSCLKTKFIVDGKLTNKNEKYDPDNINYKIFYITDEVLNFVSKYCDIDYIEHGLKYQRLDINIFPSFINCLYKERQESKIKMSQYAEGTQEYYYWKARQQVSKLLLNSAYGKLCEKPYLKSRKFFNSGYWDNDQWIEGKKVQNNNIDYDGNISTYLEDEVLYWGCLSGAYCTFKARLVLLDKVIKVIDAGGEFLYCDTDSVIFAHPNNSPYINTIFGANTGKLGEWKDESKNKQGFTHFLNPGKKKKYALWHKDHFINAKFVISGTNLNKQIINAWQNLYLTNKFEAVNQIELFFNPSINTRIVYGKKASLINWMGQMHIVENHFHTNQELKKVHYQISFVKEIDGAEPKYIFTKVN